MRILIILLLFTGCTQKVIYFKRENKDRMKQITLLGKKHGVYRGAVISYQSDKNHQYHFSLGKKACNSFSLQRFNKVSNKSRENLKKYIVSTSGDTKAVFSEEELYLLSDLKKVIDSLGWCHSAMLSSPESLYLVEINRTKKPSR